MVINQLVFHFRKLMCYTSYLCQNLEHNAISYSKTIKQNFILFYLIFIFFQAAIAQLGERQTEDLKVPGSIPGRGSSFLLHLFTDEQKASMPLGLPQICT